jgi:hypothetical protein
LEIVDLEKPTPIPPPFDKRQILSAGSTQCLNMPSCPHIGFNSIVVNVILLK